MIQFKMSNKYRLRDVKEEDLDLILTWRNSERIRRNMYSDHIITKEEHVRWFHALKENTRSVYLVFEINDRPCGMVYFLDIDYKSKKCFWGFYLSEENFPKGTGYIMGSLGVEFAFKNLGMRKICGEVFSFNYKSINFHKKLGFIQEGYFKKHVFKNGNYEDVVFLSLFKEDLLNK